MEATYVSLRQVFEKTLKTQEEDFGRVMKHAITMSRRPTQEDTLCELSRSEIVCLMAITSLGMLDVSMSKTMSRAVDDWKIFPNITAYFGGKLRVEYNIPQEFLVRAYKFALYGNKLGFLRVPSTLLNFMKVLINEAKVEDNTSSDAAPSTSGTKRPATSAHKGNTAGQGKKSHKHPAASRPPNQPGAKSPPSASPAAPPIAEPCFPPTAKPNPTPVPQKAVQAKEEDNTSSDAGPSTSGTKRPATSVHKGNTAGPSLRKRKKSHEHLVPEDRERATQDLWKAVKRDNDAAVEAALEAGGDVRARDVEGSTPLHEAAARGNEDAVRSLLAHGAEVDVKGKYRRTALHWAVRSGSVGCVRALLDAGADISAKADVHQWTPLHYAAGYGNLPNSELLVERGADLNAKDGKSYTPLTLAVIFKYPTVQQYLRSVGGTR